MKVLLTLLFIVYCIIF